MLEVEIWEINARNFDNDRTAFDIAFDENEAIGKQEELYGKGFDIVEITYAVEKGDKKNEDVLLIGKGWVA